MGCKNTDTLFLRKHFRPKKVKAGEMKGRLTILLHPLPGENGRTQVTAEGRQHSHTNKETDAKACLAFVRGRSAKRANYT